MLYYKLKCDECESEEVEILVKVNLSEVPLSKVKLPNGWTIYLREKDLVKCVGPICHAGKESSKKFWDSVG